MKQNLFDSLLVAAIVGGSLFSLVLLIYFTGWFLGAYLQLHALIVFGGIFSVAIAYITGVLYFFDHLE